MFGRKVKLDAKPQVPEVSQSIAPYWEIITEQDGPDGEWEWTAYYSQFPRKESGQGFKTRDEALSDAKAHIGRIEHRKASRQVDIITRVEEAW